MELLLMLFFIGLFLLILSIYKFSKNLYYKKHFEVTMGIATDFDTRTVHTRGLIRHINVPIVTYEVNNVKYRITVGDIYTPGKQYIILYNPENPKEAIRSNDDGLGIFILALLFLALPIYAIYLKVTGQL